MAHSPPALRCVPVPSSVVEKYPTEGLRERSRGVRDPAPIPSDELQRTYEWVKSWGMLDETESPLQLVNMDVQTHSHIAAE